MKTNKYLRRWATVGVLMAALLSGPSGARADQGSDGGNGGEFREMQFISLAYEALDLMTILQKRGWLYLDINLHD